MKEGLCAVKSTRPKWGEGGCPKIAMAWYDCTGLELELLTPLFWLSSILNLRQKYDILKMSFMITLNILTIIALPLNICTLFIISRCKYDACYTNFDSRVLIF